MARVDLQTAGGTSVLAFLDMLGASEIGLDQLAITDDGYNVLVGSTPQHLLLFPSYADHPNILDKALDSTAAGRYQQTHPDWPIYKIRCNLPDFGPVSQDILAIQHIRECGALHNVATGRIEQAIAQCANIWASLPGNNYGQGTNSLTDLLIWYQDAFAKYQVTT